MSLLTQITTDLAAFFDTAAGFAQNATYTASGEDAASIPIIFNAPETVEDATGTLVSAPTAWARYESAPR